MIFLFFLFFISSCLANYDNMLTMASINISQSAYCLSTIDSWSCATCSNQNIFEIGCGNGKNMLYAKNNGHRVTGIDLCLKFVDICKYL